MSTKDWGAVADDTALLKASAALGEHGISAYIVENGAAAKEKLFSLIPSGAAVMNMTSDTLTSIGVVKELLENPKYNAIRNLFAKMDPKKNDRRMKELGAAPEVAIASVHAVTENGELVIVSNTGSQLGPYPYAGGKIIFVVGGQKVVKNLDKAMARINDYVVPLESARINKVYNTTTGSEIKKILIIKKEGVKDRIHVILVKKKLGF